MMALPFATLFLGLICAWQGHRFWAIGLWAVTLILMIALFLLHATDPLGLQF
ncbi:DUF5993 family protein [Chelativorans alearense]|uniref:DUF5993 family protein n=1 Tax=Chelativorans alearense TaxID=2681495 RepID=UPI0031B596D4